MVRALKSYYSMSSLRAPDIEAPAPEELTPALLAKHWEIFNKRYHAHALKLCHNDDVASDIVAEARVKTLRFITSYHGPKLSNWIYKIIKNCFLDLNRRGKRELNKNTYSLSNKIQTEDGHLLPEPYDHQAESEVLSVFGLQTIESIVLGKAWPLLEINQQWLVRKRWLEGLSHREIAEILDIPEGTVKSRVFRAQEALKHLCKILMVEERLATAA